MTPDEWVELGESTIVEILDNHLAATVRELEARASNRDWPSPGGVRVDPDILSQARRNLVQRGQVAEARTTTRGGHVVTTYNLVVRRDRTAIARAASRKRLLTARHAGWSRATRRRTKGLIGEAGERALFNILQESDLHSHTRRDVGVILGQHVQGGTFDTTSYLTAEVDDEPTVFTVVSEVKNRREWTYSTNFELHRFLYKAASLSTVTKNPHIVPVFVSTFRSHDVYSFGRMLGFFAVRSEHQWVLDRTPLNQAHFYEVRDELAYSDLILGDAPTVRFTRALTESLARNANAVAERWAVTADLCEDIFDRARGLRDTRQIRLLVLEAIEQVEAAVGPPPGYVPITPPGR